MQYRKQACSEKPSINRKPSQMLIKYGPTLRNALLMSMPNAKTKNNSKRVTLPVLISANKQLTENNAILAEQIKKLQENYSQLHEMVKDTYSSQNNTLDQGRSKRE
eukprot:6070628-Ditylum_brightwellii.AAC.1